MKQKMLIISSILIAFMVIGCVYQLKPSKMDLEPMDLGTLEESDKLKTELKDYVYTLANDIGERNIYHFAQLEQTAQFIEDQLKTWNYVVSSQNYPIQDKTFRNIIAEKKGLKDADQILVIGAHYDSVWMSPGANDNASGIASLLALAHIFKNKTLNYTVRFAAFTNEEPPFFQTDKMGSMVYAQACRDKKEKVVFMISLETMGYFSNEKHSQHYPLLLKWFYPDTGNFIGFIGNYHSRSWIKNSVLIFKNNTNFPCEYAILPESLPGVGWSDHWSFWKMGYPAMMVTDTAPFRYPDYHTVQDTYEKIDYDNLTCVVKGLEFIIEELAQDANIR